MVEFLYPDNGICIFTKVCSFLHYSHLKTCISIRLFAGCTLCIILFIYSVGFLVVNFLAHLTLCCKQFHISSMKIDAVIDTRGALDD